MQTQTLCGERLPYVGLRTIIPSSLRQTILKKLHEGHPGIARMKSIACSHVWWPKIDQEIEKVTHEY